MLQSTGQKHIYIVTSQTGTWLSRTLKIITGANYNHASLSLENDLDTMYSFGRRHPYNPLWAGYVKESPHYGTFKRFQKTDVIVLEIPVDEEAYSKIESRLEEMYQDKNQYHFNFIGLLLAAVHIHYSPKKKYYCSAFIRDTLVEFGIMEEGQVPPIVQPVHFLNVFGECEIYRGKLQDYCAEKALV